MMSEKLKRDLAWRIANAIVADYEKRFDRMLLGAPIRDFAKIIRLKLAKAKANARLIAALERQTDNMAFLLNHANTAQFYDKFSAELAEDRAALSKARP